MKKTAIIYLTLIASLFVTPVIAEEHQSRDERTPEVVGGEFSFWLISTSDIQLKSDLGAEIGTLVDLEKALGVDETIGAFEFTGWIRLLKRHRLIFGFVPFRFDGEATISDSITFSGATFSISETVTTDFEINWFNVFYEFDLIYNDFGILGLRVGAEVFDVNASLTSSLISVDASADAAAPAVGVYGEFYITPTLAFEGKLDGFVIDIGDVDLTIFDAKAGLRYDFSENIGLYGGIHWLSIDITVDEDSADVDAFGPFISGSVRF